MRRVRGGRNAVDHRRAGNSELVARLAEGALGKREDLARRDRKHKRSTPIPVVADLNQKDSYAINIYVRGYSIRHEIISNATAEQNDLGIFTDTTETKNNYLYGTFGFRSLNETNVPEVLARLQSAK